MKMTRMAVAAIGLGIMLVGCPPIFGPDLQITEFEAGDPPAVPNLEGFYEVPVTMVVKNTGGQAAAEFKSAVYYTTEEDQTFVAAFTVEGQADIWYPRTAGELAAGAEVEFEGHVSLPDDLAGSTVVLQGEADSTSGDEFMPAYGRVQETNENNNLSEEVEVTLGILAEL